MLPQDCAVEESESLPHLHWKALCFQEISEMLLAFLWALLPLCSSDERSPWSAFPAERFLSCGLGYESWAPLTAVHKVQWDAEVSPLLPSSPWHKPPGCLPLFPAAFCLPVASVPLPSRLQHLSRQHPACHDSPCSMNRLTVLSSV